MSKYDPRIDKKVYELARDYLPSLKIDGVTPALIEQYRDPILERPRPTTLPELYLRMLESIQNANMKSGVIGKAIGGVDKLSCVLEGFNPKKVIKKYGDDSEALLEEIVKKVKPVGKIRKGLKGIWPQYCKAILSAAVFLEQFEAVEAFYRFADSFDRDDRARASLPMLLDKEVHGMGFALACDFLKELGYVEFPKPDVHLIQIFKNLDLCPAKADQYQVFKAIVRVARHANVTPYNADKVFWLVGSGRFYNNPEIGKKGKIGSRKDDFVEYAQIELKRLGLTC